MSFADPSETWLRHHIHRPLPTTPRRMVPETARAARRQINSRFVVGLSEFSDVSFIDAHTPSGTSKFSVSICPYALQA